MGPIALFDKSFLQSLSLDESVWFDQFFCANISPLFYVETLADLAKEMNQGRTAEQIVGGIAEKAPQLSGAPNVHHYNLLITNLLGQHVSMTRRPVVAGGRPVESGGKKGVNFDISPEAKAFSRWQDGEYQQIERDFAKAWRAHIKAMTFESSAIYAVRLGIEIKLCKNLDDAFNAAEQIVTRTDKPYDLVKFIVDAVGLPEVHQQEFMGRYRYFGFPPLVKYAPYAAHVIKVEVFFHICVSRGFISADRPSNKIDIAYLHYLPFCDVFISGDKLHRSTSKRFLTSKQKFIWGPDLKADLSKLNSHFMELPQEVKERGIMSFASRPPKTGNFLTSELWGFWNPNWSNEEQRKSTMSEKDKEHLLSQVKGFADAPTLPPESVDFLKEEVEHLCIQRAVSRRRGSWYQVPKDLKDG